MDQIDSTNYSAGDIVAHDRSLYMFTSAHGTDATALHWRNEMTTQSDRSPYSLSTEEANICAVRLNTPMVSLDEIKDILGKHTNTITIPEHRDSYYYATITDIQESPKMIRVLDSYRCKYCLGHIDPETNKCPYCDTQY